MSAPTVTLTAPSGATFPAAPTPSGYSCILNSSVLITCSYTGPLAIASGASLPSIVANAVIGAVGSLQFGGSLADTTDGATTTTGNGSVTSVQGLPDHHLHSADHRNLRWRHHLSATGGASGNPVTFTIDGSSTAGVCSLAGAALTYTGVGNCIVDANQTGNTNYAAAPQVQKTIAISKASQTISPSTAPRGRGGRLKGLRDWLPKRRSPSSKAEKASRGTKLTARPGHQAWQLEGRYWLATEVAPAAPPSVAPVGTAAVPQTQMMSLLVLV